MIQNYLLDRLRVIRNNYFRLQNNNLHSRLSEKKSYQKERFDSLAPKLLKKYDQIRGLNIDRFTTSLWKKFNNQIERALLPVPSFSFLNDPTIMVSMFATAGGEWMRRELIFLEKMVNKNKLSKVLEEDYVGNPLLLNSLFLTSHTAIHHLYHLIKFLKATKSDVEKMGTILEWGGGYGSLIRLIKKFKSKQSTYIIIDTPLFSCLQWLYLSTIFGEKEINLILNKNVKIIKNKINLVPVSFLDDIEIKADLFISTWALSESSKYSQDFVLKKNWFDAKHILLAYQDNPEGLFNPSRVGSLAQAKGAIIEDMPYLRGNHYAFL